MEEQKDIGAHCIGAIVGNGKSANLDVGQLPKVVGEGRNSDRMAGFLDNSCIAPKTTSISMGVKFCAAMCGC